MIGDFGDLLSLKHKRQSLVAFTGLEGVNNVFSHVSLILVATSCRRPSRYVPYKGTFVPYDGTYGAPDQGQTLDVCESQTTESALKK